ncbi:hypothetical protein FQA39_LY04775 [Lamprigera yunnana]|nr:hypothetical protein FQA39_LY04775 [Lamprigera yunnana]
MVRTAATAIRTGGKNQKSRQSTGSATVNSTSSYSSERSYTSHNSIHPRETPGWQKPITSFFQNVEKTKNNEVQNAPKESVDDVIVMNPAGCSHTNSSVETNAPKESVDDVIVMNPAGCSHTNSTVETTDENFHETNYEALGKDSHENNNTETRNADAVIENEGADVEETLLDTIRKIRRDKDELAVKKRKKITADMYANFETFEKC